jgi:membrane-bound lytic murein transglycosylase F
MQVLPQTAATVGVQNLKNPASGLLAGVRYLDHLRDRFDADLPVKDRTWFAVASYHAGASRIERARERAAELGLDPDRWFGHVERAMLALADETRSARRKGMFRTTVAYVREVRTRFDTYVQATSPELAATARAGRPSRGGETGQGS